MSKKIKVMLKFPLVDITQISLSPDAGNQVIVIRFRQDSQNDLVFSLNSLKNEDLTGELIGILSSTFTKKLGRKLEVLASNNLSYKSQKNNKTVVVSTGATGPSSTFAKNKDGTVTYN